MREATTDLGGEHAGVRLAWLDRGAPTAARTVVCVHGLTRNAHDFDALAPALAEAGARVIAVDVMGRGRSSWAPSPQDYANKVYAAQLVQLLRQLEIRHVDWIGTSMGGLIGLDVAGMDDTPIRRLVLNDIGPFVSKAALAPIGAYLGLDLLFADMGAVEAHLRAIHAGFGQLTDAQWRHMAEHGVRRTAEGLRFHYDPQIKAPFAGAATQDIDLWELWDALRLPVLVLRGADSALLTEATADAMTRRGPKAELVTIPNAAHAPALVTEREIGAIRTWLGLPE